MDIKMECRRIPCREKLYSHAAEHVEEHDIIVPDHLPDVGEVIDCSSQVCIRRESIEQDAVVVEGEVVSTMLYTPEQGCGIRRLTGRKEFRHVFSARGIAQDGQVWVRARTVRSECRTINSRKLNWKVTISLCANVYGQKEICLPSGVEEGESPCIQVRRRPVSMYLLRDAGQREFEVEEDVEIPASRDPVAELLHTHVMLRQREVKLVRGKVILSGEAVLHFLYTSDEETGKVQSMEYALPFSQIIDVAGAEENSTADVSLELLSQQVKVYDNSAGESRILHIELTLRATVLDMAKAEGEVICDAYATNGELQQHANPVPVHQLVDEVCSQITIKDVLPARQGQREISSVIGVRGNANVGQAMSEQGRLLLTGVVEISALCTSGDECFSIKKALPLRYEREMHCSMEGCDCDAEAEVDSISYNLNMSGELEIRVVCTVRLRVTRKEEQMLMQRMELQEDQEPEVRSGVILYYKKPEEGLWDIGKRYRVRVADLAAANGGEEQALEQAHMLLIP